MSFAHDFHREVTPRLRIAAKLHGTLHACRCETFEEAHAAIHAEAAYLGSGFLPPEIYDDLCEWVTSALLAETLAADERNATAPAPDFDAIADGCADPELMRWTLAAIYPGYRAALNASR